MNEERATELARALVAAYQHVRFSKPEPVQREIGMLRDLLTSLPDPETVLIPAKPVDEDKAEALILTDSHLFRVIVAFRDSEGDASGVALHSWPVSPDRTSVTLLAGGANRDRKWTFEFTQDESLSITGKVGIDPPGPDEAERFARVLASKLGWASWLIVPGRAPA